MTIDELNKCIADKKEDLKDKKITINEYYESLKSLKAENKKSEELYLALAECYFNDKTPTPNELAILSPIKKIKKAKEILKEGAELGYDECQKKYDELSKMIGNEISTAIPNNKSFMIER